jgi:hypothetical protein
MDFLCFSLNVTSGARAITSASTSISIPGGDGEQVRVYNAGPNLIAVMCSVGAGTAIFPTDNATPNGKGCVIPVGGVETFSLIAGADTLSAICPAAGTATMYVSRGKGA